MNTRKQFLVVGAIMCGLAVILGAFGAHGLKSQLSEASLESYKTGVHYQFMHGLSVFILGVLMHHISNQYLVIASRLFIIGTIFFSCSIYILSTKAITGLTSLTWIGPITPVGGLLMILGWAYVVVGVLRES